MALDDFDINDFSDYSFVYFVISTAGQGDMPKNSKIFWKNINKKEIKIEGIKDLKYAVFGLGDSSYVMFNKAAENIDHKMEDLGAKRI